MAGALVAAHLVAGVAPVHAEPEARAEREVRAEPRLREGAAALEAGRLEEARRAFASALEHPQSSRAVKAAAAFDLCLTYYAMGELGRALNGCYRAFPVFPTRALRMFALLAAELRRAGPSLEGVTAPELDLRWYAPSAVPAPEPSAGAVRSTPVLTAEQLVASLADPIEEQRLDAYRIPPPKLAYRVPPRRAEYSHGFDLTARTGVLLFARDASPYVAGLRFARLQRDYGANYHSLMFGEYLQGVDGQGGIGSAGTGVVVNGSLGLAFSLSVPWGRQKAIEGALVPGYTIGLDLGMQLSYGFELGLGPDTRLHVSAAAAAGGNLSKLTASIFDDDDGDADAYPNWPFGHVLLTLDFGLGRRRGHVPYDRFETFAPLGRAP